MPLGRWNRLWAVAILLASLEHHETRLDATLYKCPELPETLGNVVRLPQVCKLLFDLIVSLGLALYSIQSF